MGLSGWGILLMEKFSSSLQGPLTTQSPQLSCLFHIYRNPRHCQWIIIPCSVAAGCFYFCWCEWCINLSLHLQVTCVMRALRSPLDLAPCGTSNFLFLRKEENSPRAQISGLFKDSLSRCDSPITHPRGGDTPNSCRTRFLCLSSFHFSSWSMFYMFVLGWESLKILCSQWWCLT